MWWIHKKEFLSIITLFKFSVKFSCKKNYKIYKIIIKFNRSLLLVNLKIYEKW